MQVDKVGNLLDYMESDSERAAYELEVRRFARACAAVLEESVSPMKGAILRLLQAGD